MRSKDRSRESRAVGATRAHVLPGHEVGDGSDRWVPPVGVPGARVRSVSDCSGEEGARLAGLLSLGRGNFLGRGE